MTAHSVFGILGNVFALFVFLSPIPTFRDILLNKDTGSFSGIPYVLTVVNCFLSFGYGLLFVSKNNILVTVVNGVGLVIESIYVIIFFIYSSNQGKRMILTCGLMFLGICGTIASISLAYYFNILALQDEKRKIFCAYAVAIFCSIMYASPLPVVRRVFQTRNVKYMQFPLSLCSFLRATFSLVYGWLGNDLFQMVPNVIGCGVGLLQLYLYAVYKGQNTNTGSPLQE